MIELYAILAYFGMMVLPLVVMAVLEHYSSEVIEERHHKAILKLLSGKKKKFIFRKLRHH
ncbi:MAG: hypothetical protein MK132_02005 [Lentisphaerales bacterium]|nr:hypothetical protein [Lentisphaerales bacterium]